MGRHIKIIQPNFFSDTAKYFIHPSSFPGRQANFIKAPWDVHPKSGISFRASRLSFEQVRVPPPLPSPYLHCSTPPSVPFLPAWLLSRFFNPTLNCVRKRSSNCMFVSSCISSHRQTVSVSDGAAFAKPLLLVILFFVESFLLLSVCGRTQFRRNFFFIFELFHGVKKFQADGFYILTA